MQRWVDPNELGGVSIFLLSNTTSYIDGTVIFVNEGMFFQV
jgi:enoyl-[acyl-carrier-protein] reductase (NADH)